MSTDIQAVYVSATTTAVDHPTRLRGCSWANFTNATKEITFKDAGTEKFKLVLPTGGNSDLYLTDDGIRFKTSLHVTVPTSSAATIFVG